MKKSFWFLIYILLIIMIGCQPATSTPKAPPTPKIKTPTPDISVSNNNSSSSGNQSGSPNSSSSSNNVNVSDEINIPARNQPAPNGVLEQLSWGGMGGPSGPEQPCGNCSSYISGSRLILENFYPYQQLRLLIYRDNGEYECGLGKLEYVTTVIAEVNQHGEASLDLSGSINDLSVYQVFDAESNELMWKQFGAMPYEECSQECAGAPPQRLEVNEMAYVCTANDSVKLREGPGKNHSVIKSLVPGADLKVIGGPICNDGWSWWEVETESGFEGWMSEGGDSTDYYFLCPGP